MNWIVFLVECTGFQYFELNMFDFKNQTQF